MTQVLSLMFLTNNTSWVKFDVNDYGNPSECDTISLVRDVRDHIYIYIFKLLYLSQYLVLLLSLVFLVLSLNIFLVVSLSVVNINWQYCYVHSSEHFLYLLIRFALHLLNSSVLPYYLCNNIRILIFIWEYSIYYFK